jgi:GT2 family glycosyltransferase
MEVSIVIINYKVVHFLEQCLDSVLQAVRGIESEIIVVDNASDDGCAAMLARKFPMVICIENKVNVGFGRANNQGFAIAKGAYTLILNPDTLLPENAISDCIKFMKTHADAACIGVKMIDGQGQYLPESKRSLPTPWVSFCKIVGLSNWFPTSTLFGTYHLGYLDKHQTHEVQVLSGAFMFADSSILTQLKGFDEDFFMYGEDVDLSYRFTLTGKKNYYYPEVCVLHYKGESTQRDSVKYVKMFYEAMSIFASKHFSNGTSKVYASTIQWAIFLRSFVAIASRFLTKIFPMFIDALFIFIGLFSIINYWASHIKFLENGYPSVVYQFNIPFYIGTWLLTIYLSGGYDKNHNSFKLLRGVLLGTAIISIAYAFLDNSLRFSRAIIMLGSVWAVVQGLLWRSVFPRVLPNQIRPNDQSSFRWGAIASPDLISDWQLLYQKIKPNSFYIGLVDSPKNKTEQANDVSWAPLDELVYDSATVGYKNTIESIERLGSQVSHKIATPSSQYLIGSNSKYNSGDSYINYTVYAIESVYNKRNKRLGDIALSICIGGLFVLGGFLHSRTRHLFFNTFSVLKGNATWVGYAGAATGLPTIKPGVVSVVQANKIPLLDSTKIHVFDTLYAVDYSLLTDVEIIKNHLFNRK